MANAQGVGKWQVLGVLRRCWAKNLSPLCLVNAKSNLPTPSKNPMFEPSFQVPAGEIMAEAGGV